MHDTLNYMKCDPVHRKYHHNQMTFGMLYAYTENFVLPISHDEVVHGKNRSSTVCRATPAKFANLRYYGFMWAHPGKKLLFMGCEFAQGREWNFDTSLDWHLLEGLDNWHNGVQRLVRDLNHCYRQQAPLYERDYRPDGFEWLVVDDHDNSVFAFARYDSQGNELIAISNFTPVPRYRYRIGLSAPATITDPQYRFAPLSRQQRRQSGAGLFRSGRQPRPRLFHLRDAAAAGDHLSAAGGTMTELTAGRAAGRALRRRRHQLYPVLGACRRVELCLFDGQQRECACRCRRAAAISGMAICRAASRDNVTVTGSTARSTRRTDSGSTPTSWRSIRPRARWKGRWRTTRTCTAVTIGRIRTTAPS